MSADDFLALTLSFRYFENFILTIILMKPPDCAVDMIADSPDVGDMAISGRDTSR